jgi:hypothetical protein
MKFTVGEILIIKDNLKKLSTIKDVPAIVGYRLAAALRQFNAPLMDAEKSRNDLIKKYSGPVEDDMLKVLPKNMPKFMTELNELFAEEVEIDLKEVVLPAEIKLPDLGTLVGLDKFITVK